MSEQAKPRVEARKLQAGELTVNLFVTAAEYPTSVAAQTAWKRVERVKDRGDVSVIRLKRPAGEGSVIVALSEEEGPVKAARRLLAQGGQHFKPDDQTVTTVYMRRGQVSAAAADRPGGVTQRVSYGEAGARLKPDGQVRPHRRQG